MPTARNYSNTSSQASLTAAIAATDTSIVLTGFTGYPAAPFTAALARGTANEEVVLVTAVSGSTITVTRGYDGTTAKAQGAGTTVQEVAVALDFREANAHTSANSGVHGVVGAVVGTTDTQSLTNKTLTSPTVSGPTITGTATVATANITTLTVSGVTTLAGGSFSGNVTVGGTLGVTGVTTLGSATITTANVTTLNVSGVTTLTGALNANGGVSTTTVTTSGLATLASAQVTGAPAAATDVVRKSDLDAYHHSGMLTSSGTQTLATSGTWAAIVLGVQTFVTGTMTSDLTTGKLICNTAGKYLVSGVLGFSGNATGRRLAAIYKNGLTLSYATTAIYAGASEVIVPTPAVLLDLAVGDYVQLWGMQESTASLTADKGSAFLQAHRVA